MPTPSVPSFEGNLLLSALNARDRALLAPHLEPAAYRRGDVLFHVRDDVSHVAFPLHRAIVTLVVPLRDGKSVEAATVGHEGAIGGVVSHGYLPAFSQAVIQVGGPVLRIDAGCLNAAKHASPTLRDLFVRYADCLLAQVLQSVACNAVHPIERRCLRWLLTLQDRLGVPELPVTHEVLAEMMGVRRAYLTKILGALQREGLIRTGHGRITVLDRARVEQAACECHASVQRHFREVLGAVYGRDGEMLAVDAVARASLRPPSAAVTRKEGGR